MRGRVLVLWALAALAAVCGDDTTMVNPPVEPPRAVAISISPAAASLASIGDTATFTATLTDQNGAEYSGTVTWASDNTDIFTVNAGGRVTSTGNGTGTVRATLQQLSATAQVTVRQQLAAVMVSPAADTVAAGDTVRFSAAGADANGHAMVQALDFAWESSDSTVATVDSTGLVTGRESGLVEIMATTSGVTGSAHALVLKPLVLTIEPDSVALGTLGDTVRLVAEAEGGETTRQVVWTSSDTVVATVDARGLVRATGEGESTISAAVGASSATAVVTVALRTDAASDRASLAAFYRATGGNVWLRDDNWLTDAPLDAWHGVTTDRNGRVTHLVLPRNGATGSLPLELANLSHLVTLDLHRNKLTGQLPRQLGYATSLEEIDLAENRIAGSIPPALGRLRGLRHVSLARMWLSGSIPPELGNLTELRVLDLSRNSLTGAPPAELARLRLLEWLYIYSNQLSGVVPSAFADLDGVERFYWSENHGVCAPATEDFRSWLGQLERFGGPSCDEEDRAALNVLYEETDGRNWKRDHGWLNPELPLSDWEGIDVDSVGRVEVLDLADNNLVGSMPGVLARLSRMRVLRLGDNPLTGRIPLSLAVLPLREFRYGDTDLCLPGQPSFQAWLASIGVHEGTGEECTVLTDREILRVLYEGTGGANWVSSDNWLTDQPLESWHGIEVDDLGRVVGVVLDQNNLRGAIPPELGQLEALVGLRLNYNRLTGSIPRELGRLPQLEDVGLMSNRLSGPIPPELADLSNLKFLELSNNRLEGTIPKELARLPRLENLYLDLNRLHGTIPAELGNLRSLVFLQLHSNQLEGPIPPELGDLPRLRTLLLPRNRLTGTIPPELGNLELLEDLHLGGNQLTGTVPAELGSLKRLGRLHLGLNRLSGPIPPELGNLKALAGLILESNNLEGPIPPDISRPELLELLDVSQNPALAGPLPPEFGDLGRLAVRLVGTGICLPDELVAWSLGRVHAPRCDLPRGSRAYLTQAVQSLAHPVPLVAGEEALLRVFALAETSTNAAMPTVRASFFADGAQIHSTEIPGKPSAIPTEIASAEAELRNSANALIPADVIRPGLEMVIEIDPEGTLDPSLGVSGRIPESGRQDVFVRAMPTLDLTVVPFLWEDDPDSLVIELAAAMAADPEGHRLLWDLHHLLPVGDLTVRAHEPVLTSSNNSHALVDEVWAVRILEGGSGYWMASMSGTVTGARGVAWVPGAASYVRLGVIDQPAEALTIAHELGHNLSLQHAPCGNPAGVDRGYPYPDGSIGVWGMDFRPDGPRLVPSEKADLMSYCDPAWIGAYNFSRALVHRLEIAGDAGAHAAPARTILLWGGERADSTVFLNSAFAVDAPPALPESRGDYRITGRGSDGRVLFSFGFDMATAADSDGRKGFAFAVPSRAEWGDGLAEITLSGPSGSDTIDRNTYRPGLIMRDSGTGRVRAILRGETAAAAIAADPTAILPRGSRLEVLMSSGVPDPSAWRRQARGADHGPPD